MLTLLIYINVLKNIIMGFLESLARFMIKLFGMEGKMEEANKQFLENITLEDIEEMERQGCDATEYRKAYEERLIREEAKYKHLMESIDLSGLNKYKSGSLDPESDFVKDIAALNAISIKDIKNANDVKLVYAAVVQAHYELWEPVGFSSGPKGVVFLMAFDDKHRYQQEWLVETAARISKIKDGKEETPSDNSKLIKTLRDDESMFCIKVGASIAGDADLWCVTHAIFNQKQLPNSCLPPNRILPMILLEHPVENKIIDPALIPAKYFTK